MQPPAHRFRAVGCQRRARPPPADQLALPPPPARYTFTLTISKGSGSSLRSASASVNVRRRSGASPTGRIVRWCGVSLLDGQPVVCPARHNPTQPLSLLLFPDTGFERARVTCECPQQLLGRPSA
jgi:hypothetical protein